MNTLPYLFAGLAALAVLLYVLTDGWDLGVGILLPFASDDVDRDVMIESLEPFWDGNETWLVFGGMILLAAFPVAYATILPMFYLPLMAMLFGLVFRGVAFNFRSRSIARRRAWDWVFAAGSSLAALMQGIVLGGIIQGVDARAVDSVHDVRVPNLFQWSCGLGLLGGYALLGACWLVLKTDGETRRFGVRTGTTALWITAAFIALASIWTPLASEHVAHRWFDAPGIFVLWLLPTATIACLVALGKTFKNLRADFEGVRDDAVPLRFACLLFLIAFAGFGVSIFPYVVPFSVTIEEGAGSPEALRFVVVGCAVLVPIILGYIAFGYWSFRGKVAGTAIAVPVASKGPVR